MPVWWLYMQTANFTFWNVLGVMAQDDYFTHDCVDALRRLGVPHDRHSRLYRLACGWWPHEFAKRCAVVSAVWTLLFGGVPLVLFLVTPPYHRQHCSKSAFVWWVTGWSSSVGAALVTIVQVRAAGEGTSSPFYLKTNLNGRVRARGMDVAAPLRVLTQAPCSLRHRRTCASSPPSSRSPGRGAARRRS